VRFHQADATLPLPFTDQAFDYTHLRLLYNEFPSEAWDRLLHEVVRVTRPNGWIESLEALPIAIKQGPGMSQIINWAIAVITARGCNPLIALKLPGALRSLGLQHVTRQEINNTPNQRERHPIDSGNALIEVLRQEVVARNIATADEYDRIAERAKQDLAYGTRAGFNTYVTYGQRP
jgi:SAM-dependent methyltransferase